MSTELVAMTRKEQARFINAVYWAVVLVWAGLVFGADSLGILPRVGRADAWNWVFFGAGAWELLSDLYLAASPDLPKSSVWGYVWGGVLLILGLSGLTPLEIGFPLILLLIGGVLLGTAFLRRDHSAA